MNTRSGGRGGRRGGRRGGNGNRGRRRGVGSSAESPAPQASVAVVAEVDTPPIVHPMTPVVPIAAVAPVARDMTIMVRDLKRLGADFFGGGTDHLKAEHWLRNLKNCFKYVPYTELEKGALATFFLNGEAREWWDTMERHPDFQLVDLEGFETLFLEKYFSTSVRVKLQVEFLELVQGTKIGNRFEMNRKVGEMLEFMP